MAVPDREAVPPSLRQSAVRVRFGRPVPAHRLVEFYRVRLGGLLGTGEDAYHAVHLTQPGRAKAGPCPSCGKRMRRLAPELSRCERPACRDPRTGKPSTEVVVRDGPVRGVVQVRVPAADAAGSAEVLQLRGFRLDADGKPERFALRRRVALARGVLLILDRRYPAATLTKLHAAAAALAEDLGLKVL